MKAPSPLLGFNNNVRHKGRVFHIQTEDSGIRHPHIITHLFADGGRILKTTKTSYAEHLDATALSETVRGMMKEQHKAMFIALRDGQLDHLLESMNDGAARAAARASVAPAAAPAPVAAPAPAAAPVVVAPPPPVVEAPPVAAPPLRAPTPPPQEAAPAATRRTSRPRLEVDAIRAAHAPTMEIEQQVAPAEPSIDLDLDALERAAVEAQTPMIMRQNDLPPPPASVLGKKPVTRPATGYSVTTPTHGTPRAGQTPVPASSAGRYAAPRPAAIFAATRPQDGASIFGEDLISEKSLDEVILSYLAEDLDGPGDKK